VERGPLDRIALWWFFPIGLALLFGGLSVIATVLPMPEGIDPKVELLRTAPLWIVVPVFVLISAGEGLLWTVAFTEGFARVFRAPVAGAVCGVIGYGVLFHFAGGLLAIAPSTWIGTVLGCLYLAMRERSRWKAILNTVCLRWAFAAYAFYTIIAAG